MIRRASNVGFTLVELALVIVILGILLATGSGAISDSVRATRGLDQLGATASDTRAALDRVAREIRAVSYQTVDVDGAPLLDAAVGYGFLEATANSLRFEKGNVGAYQTVAICLLGGELRMQLGGTGCSGSILLRDVSALGFRYLASVRTGAIQSSGVVSSCAVWDSTQDPTTQPQSCRDIRQGVRLVEIAVTTGRGTWTTWAALRSPSG